MAWPWSNVGREVARAVIPGVDTYYLAREGDYRGAAVSAAIDVATFIPGIGILARGAKVAKATRGIVRTARAVERVDSAVYNYETVRGWTGNGRESEGEEEDYGEEGDDFEEDYGEESGWEDDETDWEEDDDGQDEGSEDSWRSRWGRPGY